ncbi:MAG: hypothetical protein KF886_16565 [Candidatus Hydrogenedentes bacterium]|nr:hypothetical protein [Candidatus Hydrogenedentota bacterium]
MNTLNCIKHFLNKRVPAALLAASLLFSQGAPAQEVRGGGGASLGSIAGSETLVTVVLKAGAEDPNLQVSEVRGETISFTNPKGNETVYRKGDIDHIRVQGDVVQRRLPIVRGSVALRPEDQMIVDQARSRAGEIFRTSQDNQELRIQAAALTAYAGDEEAAGYLTSLAESNNIRTQIDAARGLYLAGKPAPGAVITGALDSNNRNVRAAGAELAGLFKIEASTPVLMNMFSDRSAQYAAPAAVALARLGNREIIPGLFDMIGSISDEKNKAGVRALIILGGEDVIESTRRRIRETQGLERFRLIRVLFALGDEDGRKELIRVFNEELTITPEAALLLASDQYWDAAKYLQDRLRRREDDTYENMSFRARNANALMTGGDPSAVHVFQDLLRRDDNKIKAEVLDLIAESGARDMLKLIQTSITNVDPALSIMASNAAMAIANPSFRERLLDLRVSP